MPAPAPPIAAIILAGGRARRMGGGDKLLLRVGGRTVLERTRAVLAGLPLALSANGDPARFGPSGLPVLADGVPGQPGPLAGLLAGLDWAAALGAARLLSVPGDCPFLPPDLVARLAARPGLVLAASGGRLHPVVGLWPVGLRCGLRGALAAGEARVAAFAARHPMQVAEWPAGPPDPFLNLNRPEDLAMARALARPACA